MNQTSDYSVVQLKRQDEFTRAIQGRVSRAREKQRIAASARDITGVEAA